MAETVGQKREHPEGSRGPKEKKARREPRESKEPRDLREGRTLPQRVYLRSSEIKTMPRPEIMKRWKSQDVYIDSLLASSNADEIQKLRDSEAKLQQQLQESVKRENVLNMKLTTKHQEMQDLLTQIHDLKQAQSQNVTNLHAVAIDPAINLVFQKMKGELQSSKEQLEQAQSDLSAWKFTPDSVTGKKLMSKCRALIQENQQLGKQLSQGRIAQLEAEIALQKKYSLELKGLQNEMSEYVLQMDEECEGMQGMVMHLKQKVKQLEAELKIAKSSQKQKKIQQNDE